jgi:hypothetical protein
MVTQHLVKDALLCCPESEVALYSAAHPKLTIVPVPDEICGLSKLRNWVLKKFDDECVIMLDDDIIACVIITHANSYRTTDCVAVDAILSQAAVCCKDAGARVFGFNQAWDVRKYNGNKPFMLSSWVGGVIGIVGRGLWFDEKNMLRVDIDYCLQSILRDRIIWKDNRYSFCQARFSNKGGNSLYRTKERDKSEMDYIKAKWGRYLKIRDTKVGITLSVSVERTRTSDKI